MTGPRIASLCSGYGGLEMAIQDVYGGEAIWHADPDPGASKILAHHWPTVPNLGDITKTDWHQVLNEHGPVDIASMGFPCTDVSLAGLQAGIAPGTLVIWDRQPHRIVELAERPLDLWGEKHEMRYATAVEHWEIGGKRGERPEKTTWRERPYVFVLQPDGKPHEKPIHLIGSANHSWDVLPEHYAICSACGELPPCRHELAEREADQYAAHADVLMDIPPGHCLGCGEFVTSRQQATRFPGPNLWRPDLSENSAVFHARQECSTPRERYREQWEARGGMSQQPSLFPDGQRSAP